MVKDMADGTDKQEEPSTGFGVAVESVQDCDNKLADYAIHSTNSILCLRVRAITGNETPLDNSCNISAQNGQHDDQGDSSKPIGPLDNVCDNIAQSGRQGEQGNSSKHIGPFLIDDERSDSTPHSLNVTSNSNYNAEGISFDDSGVGIDSKLISIPSEMHCETVDTFSDQRLRQRKMSKYIQDLGRGECFPNTYRNYASEDQSSDRQQSIHQALNSLETQTEEVEVQDWLKLMKICSLLVLLFVAAILVMCYCYPSTQLRDKHAAKDTEIDVADELREWKKLARHLDVEELQINRIDASHSGDEYEKGYQMLMYWKDKDENEATVQVLLRALKQIHRRDIIKKLKEY